MHPLHDVLEAAAAGRFPPVDGLVEVMEPWRGHHAVVEFTGHAVILTNRPLPDVIARGADGFGGASQPDLLRWLAGQDGWIGCQDVVLVARSAGSGRASGRLRPTHAHDDHPRVRRSRAHREDVQVYADADGLVTIGAGLAGRRELSLELFTATDRGSGAGRRLIGDAVSLVGTGELLWAQVAPGNAASLRAFLSCGFVPIGSEILLQPAAGSGTPRARS